VNVLPKDWVFRLGYRPYFLFFDETIIVEKFEKVTLQMFTDRELQKGILINVQRKKELVNPFYRVLSETQEIPKLIASFFLVQLFTYYFD